MPTKTEIKSFNSGILRAIQCRRKETQERLNDLFASTSVGRVDIMKGKDFQARQKEIEQMDCLAEQELALPQQPNEIRGRNLHQPDMLSGEYHLAIKQLQKIFEVRRNELREYPDDLPTSFVAVEMEIAKCISICLQDLPSQKRDVFYIQSLLRDYKAVVPVRSQNPTVSLNRVHAILQDNFQGSFLLQLFNLLLAGFMNTQTKVVDIF